MKFDLIIIEKHENNLTKAEKVAYIINELDKIGYRVGYIGKR